MTIGAGNVRKSSTSSAKPSRIWRSPTAPTPASACTWRAWRRACSSTRCSIACRTSASIPTRRTSTSPAWRSAHRAPCPCCSTSIDFTTKAPRLASWCRGGESRVASPLQGGLIEKLVGQILIEGDVGEDQDRLRARARRFHFGAMRHGNRSNLPHIWLSPSPRRRFAGVIHVELDLAGYEVVASEPDDDAL